MLHLKDFMTTEMLRKKFKSSFALVNYGISLSHNIIKSGRKTKASVKHENPSLVALEEVLEGVDEFVEIKEESEGDSEVNEAEKSRL